MSELRLDVMNADGTVFRDRSVSDIQGMVDVGAVGPDSRARKAGGDGDWKSLSRLKGIDWSRGPQWSTRAPGGSPPPPTAGGGAAPRRGGLGLVLAGGGIGVVLLAAIVTFVVWSGKDEAAEPSRDKVATAGSTPNGTPVGDTIEDRDPLDDLEAFIELQGMVAADVTDGWEDLITRSQEEVRSGAIDEIEARRRFSRLLSPETRRAVDRFVERSISDRDRDDLASLGTNAGLDVGEAACQWLIFEILLAFDLSMEVWQEESTLREIDSEMVASIGFVGENTRPFLDLGIELVRRRDGRCVYRCFGGSLDFELITRVNGDQVLGGSAIQIRDAVAVQSFEKATRGGVDRTLGEGAGAAMSSLIGDYIERFENQPWAGESIATRGISIANIVAPEEDYVDGGSGAGQNAVAGGYGPDWFARHHRAIPLMWMVDADDNHLGHGTGFVVTWGDRWYVVTNRHVVEGADKAMMVFMTTDDGGRPIDSGPTAYVRLDRATSDFEVHQYGNDIAVVEVTADRDVLAQGGVVPLPMAYPDDVSPGAMLVWCGHPASDSVGEAPNWRELVGMQVDAHRVTRGEAAVMKRETLGYDHMHANAPWQPFESYAIITTGAIVGGNSGGPMIRAEDGVVVGVCTAGRSQQGGERNIGIRARHVIEAIESGIPFDPATMSNVGGGGGGQPAAAVAQPDRAAVFDVCPALQEWPLSDDEIEWLDWAVTPGQNGGNWSPLYCTIKDLPAEGMDLDLRRWMQAEGLDLRSQYWVFASPETSIDIDLYALNNLDQEVARDDGNSFYASIRFEGVTGDDGAQILRVHNHDGKATRVLLFFCKPLFADPLAELEASCTHLRNWPLTDAEHGWLSWAIRQGEDGGGWSPLHCQVFDLPADGTAFFFEDWIRSQKLPTDKDYWVFVSPQRGDDIDMFAYDSNDQLVVKDDKANVYASFRVDRVGGRGGVRNIDVVNHGGQPSRILLIVCN